MTVAPAVAGARERLGHVGAWLSNQVTAVAPVDTQRRELARIEELGYRSAWTGESPGGRDIFGKLGIWLAATDTLVVGSGIANLWARPGMTMTAGAATLADAYPGRLVLGVGVGFPLQATALGRSYGKPLERIREYLGEMDSRPDHLVIATVPDPAIPYPRVLAAVGPKMTALAGELADGVHPYASPVATTARSRAILGPDKLVIPEQLVIYHPDRAVARKRARAYRARSLAATRAMGVSPYARNLISHGFTEEQVTTVDDAVVDAIMVHGDETAVVARVREHLDAGADHVLINPVGTDLTEIVDVLARLAEALGEV